CMFIEFGFDSIGVREVHAIGRRENRQQVLWNVTLAKLVTCAVTAMVAIPVLLLSRKATESAMAWAMLGYMVAFALDANWYLRSLERTRSVMFVAGISRAAGIVVLVALVTEHASMARALWTYAFVVWANAAAGWMLMYKLRLLRRPRFDLPHLRSLFASGGAIVFGNLSGASLTSGGIAVLGVFADPLLTGAANMALRIRTAGQATLLPLSQLGFVRLSAKAGADRAAAVALGRRLFYALMAVSTAVALVIISEADRIAALAYGLPDAPPVAGVLVRILAVGLPANVAGTLFGLQCLTLFKHERAYVAILLAASAIFFGLLLSSVGGSAANYGWALLAAETWVVLSAGLYLRRIVRAP
ncbi:MAG TPA: oligosaccharide flippase family protein, partial [Ramlibacter sp.]